MKRGEHGDRNVVKAEILMDVLYGRRTYEELKNGLGRMDVPIPMGNGKMFTFRDRGTSPKDIHYHLMHPKYGLVGMGILTKTKTGFRVNMRTRKDVERIIELLVNYEPFHKQVLVLFDLFVKENVVPAHVMLRNPEKVSKTFNKYMTEYLSELGVLKYFLDHCLSMDVPNSDDGVKWWKQKNEANANFALRFFEFIEKNQKEPKQEEPMTMPWS